jgi:hypothetical protein
MAIVLVTPNVGRASRPIEGRDILNVPVVALITGIGRDALGV